ncbi:hypothetical protein BH20ACI4_BH20ACI4_14970 [soil metagenome]
MKICPKCKQIFLDEYKYCLTDGFTLEDVLSGDLAEEDFSNAPTEEYTSRQIKLKSELPQQPQPFTDSRTNKFSWLYLLAGILIAAVGVAGYFIYKPVASEIPKISLSPSGRWKGEWTSPNGNLYIADVNLNDDGANNFSGQIVYTLKQTKTRATDKSDKSAIEHIEGIFNPITRLLMVKGVRKDDPNNIIILDEYQLILSEDNQVLDGKSKNGRLNIKRQ